MRILIIGSGGREHALAWKLSQSPQKPELFIAPGNGGTASLGENIPVDAGDVDALMKIIAEKNISFVIPGPELPLVNGIVDACQKANILCFGPCQYAAQLEGSKAFTKRILQKAGVPTADFAVFTDFDEACSYIKQKGAPIVVKADGLAAGKGVVVAKTEDEAIEALESMLIKKEFGTAGETVVIEETLVGEEASFLAICQGDTVLALPSAQDHKAAYDNDQGPNTGGMGAYSPAPILPKERYEEITDLSIRPIMKALKEEGHPFSGILYAGLMMTAKGPYVLEYNVRFGDPECQPLLMRIDCDLLDILVACAKGELAGKTLPLKEESALCVVMAAEGYPASGYAKGMEITDIHKAEAIAPGLVKVFQAGTTLKEGKILSSGGRVLGVTALGETLEQAQKRAYEACALVNMPQNHYRKDIGNKGLAALKRA